MAGLRAIAPAKINWTLEALRIRPDGYHEIRSVMQTIGPVPLDTPIHDSVTVSDADGITLELTGEPAHLRDEPSERNLAFRAAVALRSRAGIERGARIVLEKRIPIGAGLGGGSSDAAATLRALNPLWGTQLDDAALAEIGAELGSDVPFFIYGGTAAISGRGETVEPLPDARADRLLLALPPSEDRGAKTASMYGALNPDHYTAGDATLGVRDAVAAEALIRDGMLMNVFERVTSQAQPETERAMDALRAQGYSPHLAGAGPSFFLLHDNVRANHALTEAIRELGFTPLHARALPRIAALAVETV
jgi:4-diphosphocytidyl-2-C-methyl-D-erythritol kinase